VTDRKCIFQVAYREEHFLARANLLRRRGYTVTSTIGNEAAKAVLPTLPQVDLLIIGHAAPAQTRLDMVAWLRERYPRTSILALNPPHERLGTLRFNAVHYPPQAWLPLIEAAFG
jgi:CheY-like chemotaxis protein